jgi:zinc protease
MHDPRTPRRRRGAAPALALALTAPLLAAATGPSPVGAQSTSGEIAFESYHLPNGLHVVLAPDAEATTVTVNLWYKVGSQDERPGRSGFGHLFEHLMFQGSENVAMGEHFKYVERAGGNLNASITEDRTNYYETLPPDRLNLALWLESDRMRSLRITFENMKREVEVVKEERRLRIDNSPYGTTLLQSAFYGVYDPESCFPYAHSVIGSMEDLDAAQLEDVQAFFNLYYAPNNATLTIVGAFSTDEAKGLVEEYFGSIPRGAEPPVAECTDPFRRLPRVERIMDPNAQLPGLWVSYAGVARSHPDAPALTVLADILGGGQSSRLYRQLVRGDQVALQTAASATHRLGPGIFQVIAIANQGVDADRLLEALDAQVAALAADGVTEAEVARARSRVRASTVLSRQTTMGRAEALQSANRFYGTPEAANTELAAIDAVTVEDVLRVARTYLDPARRAVFFALPAGAAGDDR